MLTPTSASTDLKWLNMTMPQALEIDNHIESRNMSAADARRPLPRDLGGPRSIRAPTPPRRRSKYSLYALEWYCWVRDLPPYLLLAAPSRGRHRR